MPAPRWKRDRKYAFSPYARRDALLRELGFSSYQAYLDSDLWADIRDQVLERDGHTCRICLKPANQVHHQRYSLEVLTGQVIHSLRAICGGCHRAIEFDRHSKAPINRANQKMRRRAKRKARNELWKCSPEYRRLYRDKKIILAMPKGEAKSAALARVRDQLRRAIRDRLQSRHAATSRADIATAGTSPKAGLTRQSPSGNTR